MKKIFVTISVTLCLFIACAQEHNKNKLFYIEEREFKIKTTDSFLLNNCCFLTPNRTIQITLIINDEKKFQYTDDELFSGLILIIIDSLGIEQKRRGTCFKAINYSDINHIPSERNNNKKISEILNPCKIKQKNNKIITTFFLSKKFKSTLKREGFLLYGFDLKPGNYYIQVGFGINSAIEGFGDSGKINQKQPEYIFITEKVPLYVK